MVGGDLRIPRHEKDDVVQDTLIRAMGRMIHTFEGLSAGEFFTAIGPALASPARTGTAARRWQNGGMCLRWTAAGMLEAEANFRRIIGYTDLAKLAVAVERDVAARRAADTSTTTRHTSTATAAPEVAASLA